jgi:hypothetical protein
MQATEEQTAITRLTKDLITAAKTLSSQEARYLVDYYYISQEDRKRAHNQERAMIETVEPCAVIGWLADQSTRLENQIKRALDSYAKSHVMGEWMYSITGIGPVISAGLLAHIDITKAPTVGHIWRYAGLDPTSKWEKGCKRPWNAKLKTLCWKIGQSFMKLSNNENCFYGKIYKERKALEIANNEAGKYTEQAKAGAERVGKTTEAYKHYMAGKLPPAQIDARARRYAVKLFLAHLHSVWYEKHFGTPAPKPYPIAILGHIHEIKPPS